MREALSKRVGAPAGLTLVMTDLFVSASSTLIILLALAQKEPPRPLPIQADLVAFCPSQEGGAFRVMAAVSAARGLKAPGAIMIEVADMVDLAKVAGLPGLFPAQLHVIALSGSPESPLDAECLIRFRRQIVFAHNNSLAKEPEGTGFRRIFDVVPVADVAEGEDRP